MSNPDEEQFGPLSEEERAAAEAPDAADDEPSGDTLEDDFPDEVVRYEEPARTHRAEPPH